MAVVESDRQVLENISSTLGSMDVKLDLDGYYVIDLDACESFPKVDEGEKIILALTHWMKGTILSWDS